MNTSGSHGNKRSFRRRLLHLTGFPNISIVFILLLLVVILNSIINYRYLAKERENIQKITDIINPYIDNIDQLQELIIKSKMYTTNWVYVQNYLEDKIKLDSLHQFEYPELAISLKKQTNILRRSSRDYSNLDDIEPVLNHFDSLIFLQKRIMKTLDKFDDYENPQKKFEAEDLLESLLFPKTEHVLTELKVINMITGKRSKELKQSIIDDSYRLSNILIVLSFSLIAFLCLSIYIIIASIRRPTVRMKNIIDNLAKGELHDGRIEESDNIIGEMAFSINQLNDNFRKTAKFAQEIEKGNLKAPFKKLSENDHLGEALICMRDSLSSYAFEMENRIKAGTEEVMIKSREIETQKLFYESILSSIPMDIAIYNENKEYVYINHLAVTDINKRKDLIGKSDLEYCRQTNGDIDYAVKLESYFNVAKESKSTTEFEEHINDPDGSTSWKIKRFTPVFEGTIFRFMIAYGLDITNIKKQEILIKDSLEEKESLLGEIHHRVKNNLTLVLGLVEMQRERLEDVQLKNQFNEIKNRIFAMSLIHDKMYKSNSFSNIELNDYIKNLVSTVSKFYGKENNFYLSFNMEQVFAKGKDAIPIALLVNEIVTNSFKYAFNQPNNFHNELNALTISLHKSEDPEGIITLKIKDNGPGMPEGFDINKSKSLGFKLITIFVKQLKGELIYYNDKGLTFEIKFKL